jgi:DNA-binding response OmpR family regulator
MPESILNDKRILAVDDETDVLAVLKDEIMAAAPRCSFESATSFEEASELLASWTYDLVILDIMGVRGFDLLKKATARAYPIPTVILTAHSFSPDSLKKSVELGARAYLPKERLGALVPFLEDVLTYEYGSVWKRVLKQAEGIMNESWGPYWRNPDAEFWKDFEEKIERPQGK